MSSWFGMADANTKDMISGATSADSENSLREQEIYMFEGKNNRLLDSFSFRAALITAVLALWSGAGYVLLALA
jgi:hypothetical protein